MRIPLILVAISGVQAVSVFDWTTERKYFEALILLSAAFQHTFRRKFDDRVMYYHNTRRILPAPSPI
jgi:hypothetical protein